MDLTEFLLARIAEDEASARTATNGPWRHDARKEWHVDPQQLARARQGTRTFDGEEFVGAAGGVICVAATGPADERQSMYDADHIARHDPARVLAECESKRRIVELVRQTDPTPAAWGGVGYSSADQQIINETLTDDVLPLLALPYADHPDYDPAWRP